MAKAKLDKNIIKTSEHVFIAGMTGTGKSMVARAYLSQFPKVVMLDSKGDSLEAIAKGENPWSEVDPSKLTIVLKLSELDQAETPYIIYVPDIEEMNEYSYNEFFKWAYFKKDITVWVDEAMAVSKNAQSIPFYYKAILTRGRSRNTAVWSLTQRPAGLSQDILSQSTHMFIFNLKLPQDRERIAKTAGLDTFYTNPGGHDFWYWKDGNEEAVKAHLKI